MDNTEGLTVRCPVKVVAGKYCGIIDDCGGAHGLKHLLNVLKEGPENEEYAETMKWLDKENFNFKEFDVEEINSRIKSSLSFYKDTAEDFMRY